VRPFRRQIPIAAAVVFIIANASAQPAINLLLPTTLSDRVGDHVAYIVSATASSGTLSYAWYQTGNPVVLSTSNALVLANIQPSNAGTYYVVVTDGRGSTISGDVMLNVLGAGSLPLYPTNLVVARVGDGAQILSGATGNTLYLDQYTTNGSYLNSIQIPDEGLGQPYGAGSSSSANLSPGSSALLIAGSNVSPGNDAGYEAFLGRAPNGLSLSFGGYCLAYPFSGADVSAQPGGNGGNDWRGIGTVDAFSTYQLAWTNSGLYSGGHHQIHSAVDIDGNATNYYTCGEAGSGNAIKYCNVNFQPANGSDIAAVAGSLGGTRVAQVLNGNLVFSDVGGSPIGIYACSGLPTNTATGSLVIAETNKPLDFAFSPDLRTVYITDNDVFNSTSTKLGGVQRWDALGTGPDGFPGYAYSYTLQMGNGSTIGARALTVDFSAAVTWGSSISGARLYVTTAETSGNRLLKINDNGPTSAATVLITALTNEMLCGVRFGPAFVPPNFSIQPQSEASPIGASVTFSTVVAGTGPLTYQWYFQSNGMGAFTPVANATNSIYTINVVGTSNLGNYYVVVNDPVSLSQQSQTVSISLPVTASVSLSVAAQSPGALIPPDFLGLSFETGNLQSNGVGVVGYMFDSSNTELITLFTNLGIKNLRIGGTSVDRNNEVIPLYVPTNQDVDALFRFAAAANVEVIYSLRLENGNADQDATLAAYTWTNYSQYITALAIGNEPDSYGNGDPQIDNFSTYLAKWSTFAEAVTNAVPQAILGGPDGSGTSYVGPFANAEAEAPFVKWIFSHFYVGGDSSSLTPQQIVAGMLSSNWDTTSYPSHYSQTAQLAHADGFPYRSTEFNSYYEDYPGVWGGNNVFASALFACDAAHWWAQTNCQGINFHTFLGKYNATIYYDSNGNFQIYPIGYGIKAFSLGSQGAVIPVTLTNNAGLNVTAYGVGSSTNVFVTIVNKEYGNGARNASVSIYTTGITNGVARMMLLTATNGAFATNGVTLGGAFITNNAPFQGQWTQLGYLTKAQCVVAVPLTSVAIVQIRAIPTLTIQTTEVGQFQLQWNYGTLQTTTNVTGPFNDVAGAISPYTFSPCITDPRRFYRVRAAF
jgi:hypothetical protein